jgi:hypothetical protein
VHVGCARQKGARTVMRGRTRQRRRKHQRGRARGACATTGGAHGQGAHMHASLMMVTASCHVVGVGRIRTRLSLGS